MSTPNHYETLGVGPDAGPDDVRRAFHRRARQLHPDRQGSSSPAEVEQASRAMQDVNEAWRVLRDPRRRLAYDRNLAAPDGYDVPDGYDQTWADPDIDLDPRPYHWPPVESEGVGVLLVRSVPWLALAAVLVGVFVFTAYARQGEGSGASLRAVVGECVRIERGLVVTAVPCDERNDGRAVLLVARASTCPADTSAHVVPDASGVLCLRPAGEPGAS